jgi:hypothetical protein
MRHLLIIALIGLTFVTFTCHFLSGEYDPASGTNILPVRVAVRGYD